MISARGLKKIHPVPHHRALTGLATPGVPLGLKMTPQQLLSPTEALQATPPLVPAPGWTTALPPQLGPAVFIGNDGISCEEARAERRLQAAAYLEHGGPQEAWGLCWSPGAVHMACAEQSPWVRGGNLDSAQHREHPFSAGRREALCSAHPLPFCPHPSSTAGPNSRVSPLPCSCAPASGTPCRAHLPTQGGNDRVCWHVRGQPLLWPK